MKKIQGEFSGKEKKWYLRIKNKFIIFIIFLIISILGVSLYNGYFTKKKDKDSFVVLVDGSGMINNRNLTIDKKVKLFVGDKLITTGTNSMAIIEWGDGSLTRMGGNSEVFIGDLYVSHDLGKINLSFELKAGKSWSNIISFLGEDSYFKQYFKDSEASVRGTVFNVDLDKQYLNVTNHKVHLITASGTEIIIEENKPINIVNFKFISLEEFIKNFKDSSWESLNYKIDKAFLNKLKKDIINNLSNLNDFSNIDFENINLDKLNKKELYNQILSDYQKLHFITSDDKELFAIKLNLKNKLIETSNDANKEVILQNYLYDFKDIIESGNYNNIDSVLKPLNKYNDMIKAININDYIKLGILPNELKERLKTDLYNLGNIGKIDFSSFDSTSLSNVNIKEKYDEAGSFIHKFLNFLFNK